MSDVAVGVGEYGSFLDSGSRPPDGGLVRDDGSKVRRNRGTRPG